MDSTSLLEDFHYKPSNKQSTDYAYDGNGNLIKDNNKAIDTLTYNYLNLAQHIHIKGEGDITYTYDAAGNKLAKVIADSVARVATTITYVAGFVYQQRAPLDSPGLHTDTLQLIGHEEGRVRWAYHNYSNVPIGYKDTIAYKFEYDFFERDHLGNTRTVLTQQRDTSNYIVTMEAAYRSTELQLFGNIAATNAGWTSMPNYNNISGSRYAYTNPNDSVSKVDSTSAGGQKVGPNLLLKVMSGDTVNFTVQCYYVSPGGGSTNNSSFSDVLNSLSNGLVNLTGGAHGNLLNLTGSGSSVYNGLSSFLSGDDTAHSGYPKAYLNWIFLDDQFKYDSSLSGSVLAASSTYAPGSMNLVAPGGPISLNRSGYLYIWVSNETTGWDVYFDNLSIQYKQGPLLEENQYYPFGLTMAGISDKAIKTNYAENKYRYNSGAELQNKEFSDGTGLEYYDAGFRRLDPQLGRFSQLDPLAPLSEYASPYQFVDNNPLSLTDPAGLRPVDSKTWQEYVFPGYYSVYNPFAETIAMADQTMIDEQNAASQGGGGDKSVQAAQDAIVAAELARVAPHTAALFPEFAYLDIQGVTDQTLPTSSFGVQVTRLQWNTLEDGVPTVHSLTEPRLIVASEVFFGLVFNSKDENEAKTLPNSTKYRVKAVVEPNRLTVSGAAIASMMKDLGYDVDWYGKARLYVRKDGDGRHQGKYALLAEENLEEPKPGGLHESDDLWLGLAGFQVTQGNAYQLSVTFNYNLRNEAGVMIHTDFNSTITINFVAR
jgi:RHS repeat-associated protein